MFYGKELRYVVSDAYISMCYILKGIIHSSDTPPIHPTAASQTFNHFPLPQQHRTAAQQLNSKIIQT